MATAIYLALGDSISIDDYTGVHGGGAASQLARKLELDLVDLTRDGNTTHGVLADLASAPASAHVVTLTAGGNDLLSGDLPRAILRRLHQIAQRIQPLGARVIINTVYDPSDGDNDFGRRELGLSWLATIELRRRLNALNGGIGKLAHEYGFPLADLERLFHGHGIASHEPWHVQVIEPNLAGATAIAEHWYELLNAATNDPRPRNCPRRSPGVHAARPPGAGKGLLLFRRVADWIRGRDDASAKRRSEMKRLSILTLAAAALLAVGPAAAPATASAGTAFTVPLNTSLTLSSGETVTVSGSLSFAIAQFKVQDGQIVANATLNGSLIGTTTSLGTVTATFSNAKVVLKISNLQANCQAGTLSFDFKAVVPSNGVDVTVNGEPVSLKGPIKLSGHVSISTTEVAELADAATAAKVGAIICRIDALLHNGGSVDQIVNQLNALLNALAAVTGL